MAPGRHWPAGPGTRLAKRTKFPATRPSAQPTQPTQPAQPNPVRTDGSTDGNCTTRARRFSPIPGTRQLARTGSRSVATAIFRPPHAPRPDGPNQPDAAGSCSPGHHPHPQGHPALTSRAVWSQRTNPTGTALTGRAQHGAGQVIRSRPHGTGRSQRIQRSQPPQPPATGVQADYPAGSTRSQPTAPGHADRRPHAIRAIHVTSHCPPGSCRPPGPGHAFTARQAYGAGR